MDIHIQKDTTVSLHTQLVTQISIQIASGLLKPGAKLPSIRALSKKLAIHHNTCLTAYRELADIGLIELKHGSGARVKMFDTDHPVPLPENSDLTLLAEFFTRQVKQLGYGWEEAKAALEAAQDQLNNKATKLIFIDLHADILPVFKAELEQALKYPIHTETTDSFNPVAERHSHFIVNRYHIQGLQDRLKSVIPDPKERQKQITVIDVGSGQQELNQVHKVPNGTLMAIVSASTIILRQAEAVIRAVRGEELLIRTFLYGEEPMAELQQLCQRAKIIFADWLCLPKIQPLTPFAIQPIQTIPDHEIEKLKPLLISHNN